MSESFLINMNKREYEIHGERAVNTPERKHSANNATRIGASIRISANVRHTLLTSVELLTTAKSAFVMSYHEPN